MTAAAFTPEDRAAVTELLALHGHLFDDGELHRLDELFTPDVQYDVTVFGQGVLHGPAQILAAALALAERNPVGHHVTNIVVTPVTGDQVRVRSKGLGVGADGSCSSVTYEDVVVRTPGGWRIAHRTVLPRRVPLGGRAR
ncbi:MULTISPECIES: nuclear transport factor 2 family protein [Streptomyces]|uniref:Polyketide cyclase n=2 Tax=Streptomyces TaxID=1883 RepID=A0A2N8P4T1_STRNR|nr:MULTISPECIES: nuclear transport factor 2 family protein [Streptomyces]PNE36009.1 polyketide cyclase [Streptomyces noursei]SHN14893.1 SnoaL-like domain-containing protein [Streptomyces yunnanensis]